jgi:phosphoribosylaminoimidazolecarboxamide formyltransferase / IMP cyclohydrolase
VKSTLLIELSLSFKKMTENHDLGLRKIRRALISVSDKTGIIDLARELKLYDVEIVSTGGTAKVLREAGIEVMDVSDVTGFPEMMDGRVKTLHPKIHGGLLGLRDNPEHLGAMNQHGIHPIDMVVVNLYPFEQTISRHDVTQEEAVEQIDIGGPAMIRSAAKNWHDVAVIVLPDDYERIIAEMKTSGGSISLSTRSELARAAFHRTSQYDLVVWAYLDSTSCVSETFIFAGSPEPKDSAESSVNVDSPDFSIESFQGVLPISAEWKITRIGNLRYGENPHQIAALYQSSDRGIANAECLSGKEMSFNNYVDADAAWRLVCDFDDLACAIIKHTNPAGVGIGTTAENAYRKALATDPVSAFGGIVAFNRTVDEEAATAVTEIFTEVIIAPEYTTRAVEILGTKKNLRVLRSEPLKKSTELECRQISGGMLVQTRDNHKLTREDLKIVSHRAPTDEEIRALLFAWIVCKHTKSNAIIYSRDGQTVGVGAGQMSRVDSVKIGAMRAQLPVAGSVLASDAFFPFRDGIDEAAKHGITAVIQPGGSLRDEEVITAANEHNLAMVFTGVRHFKH